MSIKWLSLGVLEWHLHAARAGLVPYLKCFSLVVLLSVISAAQGTPPHLHQKTVPADRTSFHKGVNFTAEGPDGYGSEEAARMLDSISAYGVNAVALVPYGFERFGETQIHFPGGWERDEVIIRQAAMVHQRSMKVLLKPQLWIPHSYPGDLDFSSEKDRAAWFDQYLQFVTHYADVATQIHAELFCIGVEYVHLSRYEQQWRKIIAEIRRHYSGPLVYAANAGTDFEQTRFWDALDYIGLNEYYPLPDDFSTDELARRVEHVQHQYRKPVIFTEVGFASLKGTHHAPWDESLSQLSDDEQTRCYETIFKAFYTKPWFQGMYWWKVGTNGFGGQDDRSHTPWHKPAMEVVRKWYTSNAR